MNTLKYFLIPFLIAFQAFAQENPRELFKFAKFKYDKGEYSEALGYLDRALDTDPSYANAYLLRAEIHFHSEKYAKVVEDIDKAFAVDSTYSSFLNKYFLLKAKSHIYLSEIDKAQEVYEALLARDNYYSEGNFEYAQLKFMIDQPVEAIVLINKAIKIDPKLGKLYAYRAYYTQKAYTVFPGDKRYQSINDDYNLALYLDPNNYEFYKMRSEFKRQMGLELEALTDYNKMIEISPADNYAYRERGVLKMHKENYLDAVKDFTASIELYPEDAKNFRYRGLCMHNMRKYYDAYNDFSKSKDLLNSQLTQKEDSGYIKRAIDETNQMRGHTLFAMGKGSEACVDFIKALDMGERKGLNYFRKYCRF